MDITSYLLGKKAGGGGTDTSDANATASDIALGKSGYVKGVKVNGNVPIGSPLVSTNYGSSNVSTYLDDLKVDTEQGNTNQFFYSGDKISVLAPLSDVAPVIGASAEKIKKDEVICGVTGTYEGGGAKYAPRWMKFGNAQSGSAYTGSELNYELSNLDTSNITNMDNMFNYCTNLTTLDVSDFNTSNTTSMSYMFANCSNLTTLDVSNFDVSKVTDLAGMFVSCSSLTTLDVSNFNPTRVTSINHMFNGCSSLTTLDVSKIDTRGCSGLGSIFANCSSLTSIDMRNFKTSSMYSSQYSKLQSMFYGCSSLQHIDMRSMVLSMFSTAPPNFLYNVPTTCEIIVKDATEKSWWASKFGSYTNVKTVAEYEG